MNVVKVMSTNLSNKIAAGEVVETLMNVVKELVENSIDAKADEVKIELEESGIGLIRVTDNGCGMTRDDALRSLERHATSKLYSDDDLFNINTLGFRGEAIPSIASVSKMVIKTCNGESSTYIEVEGGKVLDVKSCEERLGTQIEVRDIFYNTPARLKYLKSLYTELANITNYINKMALANPSVKFVLINNDKTLLNTDGSGNLLKVINNIYGLDVAKKMVSIDSSCDDYRIHGYISYPEVNRSSRNNITLLVNGRNVRNNDIIKNILEAYHTFLPINRYPVVVLNIESDPSIVDVNIHPTKMDVKFSKLEELNELIYKTINDSLNKLTLIPEVKYEDRPIKNIDKVSVVNDKVDFKNKEEVVKPEFEEISFDFNIKEEVVEYKEFEDTPKFKKFTPVGIVHGTYIIAENEDGMFILDQHAVNERINYEFYKEELGKEIKDSVELLIPIKIELANNDYLILKENFNILDNLNFAYEEFGNNTIIIRSHPIWIKKDYAYESIRKIIDIIVEKEDFSKEKFNEKIAITLACKMSIKANEYISLEDAKELINRLSKTDNPFTCPHGRPTIISYSKYELEKLFKRVM